MEFLSRFSKTDFLRMEIKHMVTAEYKVPIYCKLNLTIEEAAEYSNIGINTINNLLRKPNCPFALYVGTKKLVKRIAFENYINEKVEIQTA